MCRLTEQHIRGNAAIHRPGRYMVHRGRITGHEFYIDGAEEVYFPRPLYLINVRAKPRLTPRPYQAKSTID